MPIVVLENQAIYAENGQPIEFTSDPIPVPPNNGLTLAVTVHGWVGTDGTLSAGVEISNDGVYWIDAPQGLAFSAADTGKTKITPIDRIGTAYLRVKANLTITSGQAGDAGSVNFDADVNRVAG